MSLVDRLREVPLLADLPDDDLERLCRGSEEVRLAAGELLFAEGDEGDRAFVVLDGELEVVKAALGREVMLARHTQGVVGEMALLENAPRNASVRARADTTLLAIPKSRLDELLDSSPSASRAFFEVMLARWRDTRASLQHTERMAQLGTLTAGLAHELNNPAAAVSRSADQLSEALVRHADATIAAATGLEEESAAIVARVVEGLRVRGGVGPSLSAIDRSDIENRVGSWLDDHDIDRSWAVAPGLVDAGFTEQELTALSAELGGANLAEVIELIDATQDQLSILHQIEEGTRRISSIVKALKSYSYLDQAPVQDVDVTVGLEDTLLLLEHKTKDITVERRYSDDLPVIEALGSELNQVWTNLIDNAIYALHESDIPDPRLVVRTIATDNGVAVEVEDNGPGIPREIQGRIFDSFFTTKPPGSGSGLGLDISQNIVVQHHGGDLTVESRPGRTVARVELPRELPKRNV